VYNIIEAVKIKFRQSIIYLRDINLPRFPAGHEVYQEILYFCTQIPCVMKLPSIEIINIFSIILLLVYAIKFNNNNNHLAVASSKLVYYYYFKRRSWRTYSKVPDRQ